MRFEEIAGKFPGQNVATWQVPVKKGGDWSMTEGKYELRGFQSLFCSGSCQGILNQFITTSLSWLEGVTHVSK